MDGVETALSVSTTTKKLTCQGFHEEQQTDRPFWKISETFTFISELKDNYTDLRLQEN